MSSSYNNVILFIIKYFPTIIDNYLPFGERIPIHWQPGLFKRLFKKDYDAVIMMGSISYFSYLLSIPLLKFFKIPVVFWTHGFLGKDNALIENYPKAQRSCDPRHRASEKIIK